VERIPARGLFRPHFMTPGPHVEILKDKPISFDDAPSSEYDDLDEDENFTKCKYYPTQKILGKLFDAIDEREIFQRVQQTTLENSLHGTKGAPTSVLKGVWNHVQSQCKVTPWDNHLGRARGIRDE